MGDELSETAIVPAFLLAFVVFALVAAAVKRRLCGPRRGESEEENSPPSGRAWVYPPATTAGATVIPYRVQYWPGSTTCVIENEKERPPPSYESIFGQNQTEEE